MLQQGDLVDERYEIRAVLAVGGVGVVYDARDNKLRRTVAVKILKPEHAEHESLRPRFLREAEVLACLAHPNIVMVYDYGVHDSCPYLVMEMLKGRTLRTLMDCGPMPEQKARDLMNQLLEGLSHAHGLGVVHRDLKPGNIFLNELPQLGEQVKILDFGFAKLLAPDEAVHGSTAGLQLTTSGVAFGTPTYMAPEQIALAKMDARTDVYSVGILLFEMLAGAPPFSGAMPELLRRHLSAPLPPLGQIRPDIQASPDLELVLSRCTEKKPEDRFQDAATFARELQRVPIPWLVPSGLAPEQRDGSRAQPAPPEAETVLQRAEPKPCELPENDPSDEAPTRLVQKTDEPDELPLAEDGGDTSEEAPTRCEQTTVEPNGRQKLAPALPTAPRVPPWRQQLERKKRLAGAPWWQRLLVHVEELPLPSVLRPTPATRWAVLALALALAVAVVLAVAGGDEESPSRSAAPSPSSSAPR